LANGALWLWRNLAARLFMANTSDWNKAPEGQAKPQGSSARRAGALQGLGTHHIRLVLQARAVVDRRVAHDKGGMNPALVLLHHVPGLMGQVRALTGRQMGGKRQDLTPGFAAKFLDCCAPARGVFSTFLSPCAFMGKESSLNHQR
jgi:hypothetical protein